MINLIVITHGEFGAYLVEAAEWIVGQQSQGVEVISISPKTALNKVKENLNEAITRNNSRDGLIFMTDMLGGTPTNMVLPLSRDLPKSAVICGININMLVSAFSYRTAMNLEDLVKKILEDGRKSICDVKTLLKMRAASHIS
ncbi:MAG: hypothetical protein JRL30_28725 [Deltaproteobacteria bacterium]|nr:hypothetical protein [Deltaproteobacteria bacterium]